MVLDGKMLRNISRESSIFCTVKIRVSAHYTGVLISP